ncbi:MAG: Ig-like domain-containing protein [Bacteroidales bacterium]|nr:Ig-like domain-containing protein [Bacteroidales bacterium]MBQ9397393.1 Ig-like domain-containing protein [Bacteroidales bacterium]
MKRFTLPIFLLFSLLPLSCQKDIPVESITISPGTATLFVGESREITVSCFPEEATNLDELQVYSTNEKIVQYQNGQITGVGGGDAAISATCGNILSQCRVKVYKDKFLKNGMTFGIDYVTGYEYLESEPTVQEIEIILVHNEPNGDLQKFDVWVQFDQLGKELDFTKAIEGWAYVGVYVNNNEDGYLVFSSPEGEPSIHLADWGDPGNVTLTRGILKVEHLHFTDYRIHADFELSNGYRFSTDWEGTASLKTS